MNNSKLLYLEGLRGVAALIVVLHHFTLLFYPTLNYGNAQHSHFGEAELFVAKSPLNIIYNGGFAVALFFVLSGYVLSNAYHQTNNILIIKKYAIKRYVRLLVPVSATILLSFMFIETGLYNSVYELKDTNASDFSNGCFKDTGNFFDALYSSTINVFINRDNRYNPVLWTMTIELLGSFLLFAFLLVTHKFKIKHIAYIAVILILVTTNNNFYVAFIIGAYLNYLHLNYNFKLSKIVLCGLLLLSLLLCSYPMIQDLNDTIYENITFSILNNYDFYHVIGSSVVLYIVINSNTIKKLLSKSIFTYLGKISFSFYLLHFMLLCTVTATLYNYFYTSLTYNSSTLIALCISLPIIFGLSHLFYLYIDKQGIKLSERILRFIELKIGL